mmetsp:Transcript_36104/g.84621  ORF Transcript_36104/g.84621 Transcript_36104/m.84621 type:complete len:316 (-) Transcript_36104:214-1161(-)
MGGSASLSGSRFPHTCVATEGTLQPTSVIPAALLLVTVTIAVSVTRTGSLLLLVFILALLFLLVVFAILLAAIPISVTVTIPVLFAILLTILLAVLFAVLLTVLVTRRTRFGSRSLLARLSWRRRRTVLLFVAPALFFLLVLACFLFLLWSSRSSRLELLLGRLAHPAWTSATTQASWQPSFDSTASLNIYHHSAGIDLFPVSLLIGIFEITLVLILNEGIAPGLALEVINHANSLDATKHLELTFEFLLRRVVADASHKEGLEWIACSIGILVWVVLVNQRFQLLLVGFQFLTLPPLFPLLWRLPFWTLIRLGC